MRWIALPLICFAVAGIAATAATARTEQPARLTATTGPTAPLATGLGDPLFTSSQASQAFSMEAQTGAKYARVLVYWASIAPATLPGSWDPTNPASPYYHWSSLDATVSAANANGITPILNIVGAPSWGYHVAPHPSLAQGGQPDLTALGDFATAIAKHYKGPASPVAHVFSVWNEPNFNRNLYPQDPAYYRSMVNAVADAAHAVDAHDIVGAGELAPFKHTPIGIDKNNVMPPLTFMQKMLCLSASVPYTRTCGAQADFDVWTHHPYSDTGPFGHSKVSGGIELGDLPKMNSLLQSAWTLGAINRPNAPQFWVTEVGWSSKPPNTKGVPIGLETRWMAETMYQIWKSGATVGTWFLLQDQPSSTPFQSGLYLRSNVLANATSKPLLNPFTFPFVAYLKAGGKALIWGRDTTSNQQTLTIQRRIGAHGTWKTVGTIASNNWGIFTATLPIHAINTWFLRASAPGSGSSQAFALKVPTNENMNVTPFPAGGG
jgi:hypothetical protein